MIIIRTIYFYTIVVLSLCIAPITLIKINYLKRKGKLEERTKLIHKITHKRAKFVMKLNGSKITVNGFENIPTNETVLFVSNHQGYFDIPLLMSIIDIPHGFIAKKELEKIPGISMWMRYINCIFMDRENMRKSATAIVEGIKLLRGGYSMVIFPEGTRSKGNTVAEFKAGSMKLATKSKCPIIPVTIDGSYKLLESHNGKIGKAPNTVTFHKAIDATNLSKDELNELHNTVKNIVTSSLNK